MQGNDSIDSPRSALRDGPASPSAFARKRVAKRAPNAGSARVSPGIPYSTLWTRGTLFPLPETARHACTLPEGPLSKMHHYSFGGLADDDVTH
jgi:hypothetical protein